MDVRLPDGTLITGVPDGTTKAQLDAKLALSGYDTAALTSAAQANGYETQLPADQESAFQKWKAINAKNDSGADYDYRGAFEAGVKPDPVTGHWPDTFKKPNHPTFSDQSKYAEYGKPGSWDGDTYVPAVESEEVAPLQPLMAPAPRESSEEPRNIVFEVFAQVAAGAVVAVPEMIGKAADWINPGSGTDLREWAEEVEDNNPWLAQQTEGRTGVGKAFSDGARMLAPSITSVATAGVAVVLAPLLGAGAALTAAIGTGVTALTIVGLFGASQAEDTYEKLLADGVPEEDARKAAWMTGIIEAGGEGIANRFTFGLLKGVTGPLLKETAEIILRKSTSTAIIAPFVKGTLLNAAGEVVTEFGQGASQTAIENIYGAKDPQSPWSVGAEGGASALAMSVLLAPFGLRANFKRSEANAALENENAPENERYRAAVRVHAALTEFDVEQDAALKATLKDISSDNSMSDGQKKVALQEARSNARKDAGDAWASNVWARNAGLAIQQKLAVDLSPEQLTTPAEPNAPKPNLPLHLAASIAENKARAAALAPKPTAADIEKKLAAKKDDLLAGSVEDITEYIKTNTLDKTIVAANLAAGTVPNPVTVPDYIDRGYEIVPGVSDNYTRLTKTNDDNTIHTVDVSPNGVVEADTTLVGNFTVDGVPVSVLFNRSPGPDGKPLNILQGIDEDGLHDLSDKANSRYAKQDSLLDILRAEDVNVTVEPVVRKPDVIEPRRFGGLNSGVIEKAGEDQYRYVGDEADGAATLVRVWDETAEDNALAAPGTRISPTLAARQREIYQKIGVEIVYFYDDASVAFDGAVDPKQPNTIFLSNNPTRNFKQIAAHETTHVLESTELSDGTTFGDFLSELVVEGGTAAGWTHVWDLAETTAPKREAFAEGPDGEAKWSDAVVGHLAREFAAEVGGTSPLLRQGLPKIVEVMERRYGVAETKSVLQKLMSGFKTAINTMRELFVTPGGEDSPTTADARTWLTNADEFYAAIDSVYDTRYRTQLEREQMRVAEMRGAADAAAPPPTGDVQFSPKREAQGKEPIFFSALTRGVENMPDEAMTPGRWASALLTEQSTKTVAERDKATNRVILNEDGTPKTKEVVIQEASPLPGVKPSEIAWSGVIPWLKAQTKPVTKSEVVDYIRSHEVTVEEVVKGGPGSETTADDLLSDDLGTWRDYQQRLQSQTELYETREDFERDSLDARVAKYKADFDMDEYQALADDMNETASFQGGAPLLTKFGPGSGQGAPLPGGEPGSYRELLLTLPGKPRAIQSADMGAPLTAVQDRFRAGELTRRERDQQINDIYSDDRARRTEEGLAEDHRIAREAFRSGHFDEPNVLVHVRFDDRIGANGEKILHIAEVQSDWHQKGRLEGYAGNEFTPQNTRSLNRGPQFRTRAEAEAYIAALPERLRGYIEIQVTKKSGVPDAPFKATDAWAGLAMKRMLRYASENGYAGLSWDTGETNADRYDLSKQIDAVRYRREKDGTYTLQGTPRGESYLHDIATGVTENRLSDYVGKDLAEKIVKGEGSKDSRGNRTLAGADLKVGGEGMNAFYDKILPSLMNKYVKQWGAKVEASEIEASKYPGVPQENEDGSRAGFAPVHAIAFTPQMREGAARAQPLFSPKRNPQIDTGPAAEGGKGAAVGLPKRVSKGRVPELQNAADEVYAGRMSSEEYQKLVDIYKPVRPFTSVPAMPTRLDLERGLDKPKHKLIGQEKNISEGQAVGLRLDIPAYTNEGVWAPTIHYGHGANSKPIAHAPFARITDVDFGVSSDKALRVARGGAKSPFAKMDGFWTKTSAKDIQAMAEKFLNDPAWTQVGMDPERHEGFYDRKTQRQLAHADEVIQIGPLVLARNATFRNTDDIRYSVKSDKMGATGTAKAWVEFAEVKKLIDFGVVKTLAQAKTAAEADYTKTFEALPAFDAKAYLEGVVAVEGPLLPPNIHAAVQAYRDGDEGGAVGTLLADVKRARETNVARWKNYFDNVNTEQGSDPFWKSYVAHGVVDTFDATKPNTGETFNAAALATVYAKFLEGTAPNFTKAYRAAKMAATADLVQLGDAQNGWRKVPRTAKSDPDFAERVAEVQAISSESWCTRTYNAAPYIEKGDFWVYVDKSRPELAIRFEGSDVAEIQGRANNGSIPSQYADKVQELVDSGKIQNLSPETKRALQAATDRSIALKKLESETTFVEEMIDPNDDGDIIRVYRKTNGDIVIVTEGRPDLPGKYADRVVEVIGDIVLYKGAQANNLTTVGGTLTMNRGAQVNNLTTVGGGLYLNEGAQANSVTTVGGDLYMNEGAQANNLTTVGGSLYMNEGAQVNNLTTVGGGLYLYEGAQANSVTTVGGDLYLYKGAQANSVTTVGGTLTLGEGAQANSVTTVGGNLYMNEGAQANNLTTVGGDLYLYKGAQANSVTTVGGTLALNKGAQANSVTTVGGTLTLGEGAQANSVTTVGGDLYMNEGAQANSVTTVGGDLYLYKGAQANSVTTVGGNLYMNEGAQANSVTTVGGSLILGEGAQALSLQAVGGRSTGATPENTPRLKYIGDKEAVERIKAETLSARVVTTGLTSAGVQSAVSRATRNLRIKTNVYATVAEARAATGVDIPADVQAMYSGKELHFILENISSELNAEIAVWHEVTHAGLDRLYGSGSAEYNVALTTIALRNPEIQKEAAKWRGEFGADILQRAQEEGMTAEKAAQYVRMRAIDEALAVMSSQNVNIRGLDKFIAAVQKILRQVGLTKLADAIEGKTNAEALSLISKARGALLADGSYVVTGTTPAFLRGAGLQTRPLKVTGTGPNGRILNWDVGQAFTRAHKAQYGRVLNINNPADRAEMVRSLNAEYRNQTRQPDNGEEWYVEDIAKALKTTRAILPELRVPSNRDLFLAIAALTSPQQKPNSNWQNAIHAMRGYIETGRITLVKPNGTQFGVPSQTTSLQLLQHLIDTKGLAKTLRWLNASHTGQEIAEVRRDSGLYETKATLSGYVASETNLTNVYLGIEMFGPKVSDFMLNATGIDPNAVTVDMWLARTYNRLLGRLTDVSPQKREKLKIQSDIRSPTERKSIKSLIRDVAAQNGISPSAMQAALWYFEQRLYRQHGLNAESQNFSGAAALAVGNERSRSSGDVQRAGRNEVPAVSGRGKNRKVVTSIPYNSVQTTTRLNKLEEETDPVALKDGVAALARDLRRQADAKPVRERARGYDWIQERLLRAARLGEMNREQVRLGMWLLNSNPNLANDLGISLRATKSDAASGNYNPMSRIMSLFKGHGQDTLIAHEILHHAERMMPREVQDGIRAEWLSQIEGMLAAAIRTGNDEMVEHLRDALEAAAGDTGAYERITKAIAEKTISGDFYQYINPSEFWAVNAADIVRGRASESWVGRAVQWLKEFSQKIKEVFGLPSTAAVIRGLDNVINAANEGERQSPDMLGKGKTFNAMGNRTEPTLPVPEGKLEVRKDQAVYNFVDRFIDLKNLMKTIRSLVNVLPENLDAYGMVERLTGRVAERIRAFGLREINPLLADMTMRGVDLGELDEYLWKRSAEKANELIAAQTGTDFPDGGAGISTADARAYLAALTPEKRTALEALAKRVDAITAETRRVWVRYGMATLDDILEMERKQPYYVPLNREGKGRGMGTGQGISVQGPNSYHRVGSKLPVVDVLAHIIDQRNRAVTRGEKNLIGRAIYALAKKFPDDEMWKLAAPGTTTAIDINTGEPVAVLDMTYQGKDNVLMSFRLDKDGKLVAQGVEFKTGNEQAERMATALKNLDLPSLGMVFNSVAQFTRYFAKINTQYNLVFGLVNFGRDVPTALLNLSTTPIAGRQIELALHIPAALRAIYRLSREESSGREAAASKYGDFFKRFRQAGGASGWYDTFDTSADRGVALQKELNALSRGSAGKLLPALGAWVTDYNSAMENSTRLAAFITAVDAGMSDAEAASLAKNLTVNFDRKGAYTSQMSALYAFFNPSVQGTVRTLQTLKGPTGKKIIAGGLLLGAIQALFLAGFDDDDPPEFVRQRNIIIPTVGGAYVMFPLPLGFNVIPTIGRLTMQTILNPKKIIANAVTAAGAVLSTLDPLGAGFTYQTLAPTLVDPIVAIASNTDWTGRPIERKDFSALDPTPGYTRAKDSASAVSTFIARVINSATLGDKYTQGGWSPTPDLLDYLAGQATGGAGRELMNLETSMENWVTGTETPAYKVPILGRLYGDTGSAASQTAKYYQNTLMINELENQILGRRRDRVPSNDFRLDNPLTRVIPAANMLKRQITNIRNQKKERVLDDKTADERILKVMQRLNTLVEKRS